MPAHASEKKKKIVTMNKNGVARCIGDGSLFNHFLLTQWQNNKQAYDPIICFNVNGKEEEKYERDCVCCLDSFFDIKSAS